MTLLSLHTPVLRTMNSTDHRPARPDATSDERALLSALTGMLRDKRLALMDGDVSARTLAPLWQPLLERLGAFTALRAAGRGGVPDAQLRVQAEALRQEYDALRHTLQVWSDAVRLARDKAQQRPREPVYGPSGAAPGRGSLGRG